MVVVVVVVDDASCRDEGVRSSKYCVRLSKKLTSLDGDLRFFRVSSLTRLTSTFALTLASASALVLSPTFISTDGVVDDVVSGVGSDDDGGDSCENDDERKMNDLGADGDNDDGY